MRARAFVREREGRGGEGEGGEERVYHDMRSNPNTVNWESGVEFEGPTRLEGFHGTI